MKQHRCAAENFKLCISIFTLFTLYTKPVRISARVISVHDGKCLYQIIKYVGDNTRVFKMNDISPDSWIFNNRVKTFYKKQLNESFRHLNGPEQIFQASEWS